MPLPAIKKIGQFCDSKKKFLTIIGAIFIIGFSLICGLPYIQAPLALVNNNLFFGIPLAYGEWASISFITMWSLFDIHNRIKTGRIHNSKLRKVTAPSSLVLGMAAAVPDGLISFHYNRSYILTLIAYISSSSVRSCALLNASDFLENKFIFFGDNEKKTRATLITATKDTTKEISLLNIQQVTSFLSSKNISPDSANFTKDIIKHLQASSRTSISNKLIAGVALTLGTIMPLTWVYVEVSNGYKELSANFIPNKYIAMAISGVTAIPLVFLEIRFARRSIKNILELLRSILCCQNSNTAMKLYPFPTISLQAIGGITAALAFAFRLKASNDCFEDTKMQIPAAILVTIGATVFKGYSILTLLNRLLLQIAKNCSSAEEKNLIAAIEQLDATKQFYEEKASFQQVSDDHSYIFSDIHEDLEQATQITMAEEESAKSSALLFAARYPKDTYEDDTCLVRAECFQSPLPAPCV